MSAEVTWILMETADPQRNQKKLLSPEAQRVSAILANCIRKADIAVTLPAVTPPTMTLPAVTPPTVTPPAVTPSTTPQLEDVNQDLRRALRKHQVLQAKLESLGGLERDVELETDVKNSVRDLLRLFRAHPDVFLAARLEQGANTSDGEQALLRALQMFHGHVVEKLLTGPDEELQLALRGPAAPPTTIDLEVILAQEEEVAAAIRRKDAEISEKNDEIRKLQSSLQENDVQEAAKSLLVEKECQSHVRVSKTKQAAIRQEIDRLSVQLHSLILENRAAERIIQEKNDTLEREIEYLLHKFDDEIEEKQADLETSEMNLERDEAELRKLEEPYAVLEVECDGIQERRRVAEETRAKEQKELELKTKAAVLAQSWWRGYSTRRALRNRTRGKKAKKGKSKKSK